MSSKTETRIDWALWSIAVGTIVVAIVGNINMLAGWIG